ncbi:transformer 2 beta [Coemansia sp. RSA 485]|nr:transformer 2 beta [Coemansia sp. RSA 485]
MSQENPILPSEPLALEPNLIAAAVQAEELVYENEDRSHRHSLSPRRASKVRRRLDNRHYGRSESRGRSGEREREERDDARRSRDEPPSASSYYSRAGGSREAEYYEKREGRSHSPRSNEYRGYPPQSAGEFSERNSGRGGSRERDYNIRGSGGRSRENTSGGRYNGRRDMEQRAEPAPTRVLGIFGMSKFTNEQNLQDVFGKFGPIERIQIIRDSNDGRSRGYAFINMVNVDDAQAARDATTGTILHDRKVRVDFSISNKPHGSGGAGRYGGPNGDRGGDGHRHHHRGHADGRRFTGRNGYGDGPSSMSYRQQPYNDYDGQYARRRANTRDRRRRDYPPRRYPPRSGGRPWGRSKSPSNRRSPPRPYDTHRGSYGHEQPPSHQHHHHYNHHQQGYENGPNGRGYDNGRQYDHGRGRQSRGDYIPAPATTNPPPHL